MNFTMNIEPIQFIKCLGGHNEVFKMYFVSLSICIVSCGQEQKSQVKADEVLVKLPLFLSMKFDTVDVVAFSKGEDNTKFGKRIDQLDSPRCIS